jgi:hypothetical protein
MILMETGQGGDARGQRDLLGGISSRSLLRRVDHVFHVRFRSVPISLGEDRGEEDLRGWGKAG